VSPFLLSMLMASVAPAQDGPPPKKDLNFPWLALEAKALDHVILVTINGETYGRLEEPRSSLSVRPSPLKNGANVIVVAFTSRPGRDLSKAKGSTLKLGVSPSLTPAEGQVLPLCDLASKLGAVECVMRLEMKDRVPGTCKTVERHWFDPERRKQSEEYEAEWEPVTGAIGSSIHREWSPDGRKKHEVRVRAEKIAGAEYFMPDGTLGAEIKEGAGWARQWHDNGRICQETPYRNGMAEGEEKDYFESGRLQAATTYAEGRLHGPVRRYDDSGTLRVRGAHASGEKEGAWVRYDEKGKEVARSAFEKGKRVTGDDPFDE